MTVAAHRGAKERTMMQNDLSSQAWNLEAALACRGRRRIERAGSDGVRGLLTAAKPTVAHTIAPEKTLPGSALRSMLCREGRGNPAIVTVPRCRQGGSGVAATARAVLDEINGVA